MVFLLAVRYPCLGRFIVKRGGIGIEPVFHDTVQPFVDLGQFAGQRVIDVILSLLSFAIGGIGSGLGFGGRLIDLFDVELLLELSRRGVVELALLPACLRGECHADAVVADKPEQLAPGVQQRLLVQAADHTLQVDIIQIGRIARHLDPEDGEVRKVTELCGDILGRKLPVADIAEITLVGARRVARALPGGIRERSVGYEGHRFHRIDLLGKGGRQGAQLVAEPLVAVAQDLRDTEIDRCEACEREVAPAVVGICRRIVRRVEVVEDTHADIPDSYGADLSLFEFERYELLLLVHALDHPGARSAPVVPDADAHTVVPKLRNLQKTTDEEALQLAGASSVDLCTEAGDAAGEVACPESLVELLPLKESGDSFDRTSPALVQKFPFALTRRIERRVARRCFLPRFNDVRKFR